MKRSRPIDRSSPTTSSLRQWEDPAPAPMLKRRRGSSIKHTDQKSEFITIEEAAELWRCSRRKVERKLKARVIPKFKDGHRTLLRIKDVRAHSRKMRQK